MSIKKKLLSLTGFGFLVMLLFIFRETALYKIGTFLVIDQDAGIVDAVVSSSLGEKVVQCYKLGNCRKIVLTLSPIHRQWKGLPQDFTEEEVRGQAEKIGIKNMDLIIVVRPVDKIQLYHLLGELFLENDIHSAVFYTGYYRGRRWRFYLDRYFDQPGIVTYVQTNELNKDYMRNFDRWWENTILDNQFLDEYLSMLFYYFNKVLWSSPV